MTCLFLLEVERAEFEPEPGVEKSSSEGSIKKEGPGFEFVQALF